MRSAKDPLPLFANHLLGLADRDLGGFVGTGEDVGPDHRVLAHIVTGRLGDDGAQPELAALGDRRWLNGVAFMLDRIEGARRAAAKKLFQQ